MHIHPLLKVSYNNDLHKASGALPVRCSNICVYAYFFSIAVVFLENYHGYSWEPNLDSDIDTIHVLGLGVYKGGYGEGEIIYPNCLS